MFTLFVPYALRPHDHPPPPTPLPNKVHADYATDDLFAYATYISLQRCDSMYCAVQKSLIKYITIIIPAIKTVREFTECLFEIQSENPYFSIYSNNNRKGCCFYDDVCPSSYFTPSPPPTPPPCTNHIIVQVQSGIDYMYKKSPLCVTIGHKQLLLK